MNRNVEIKAKLSETQFESARSLAQQLSGTPAELLIQTDTFFNCAHGRLKLREFADGTGELIFYQRPDAEGAKTSNYLRSTISHPEELRLVLQISLGVQGVVRKRRELCIWNQTRIHLDEVEGLGKFLELEVVLDSADSISRGEQIVESLMQQLGIGREDLIAGAYLDLMRP